MPQSAPLRAILPALLVAMPLLVAFASAPLRAGELETVATFDATRPPGNIAVGPDGRIFMSLHKFYGGDLRIVEVLEGGETRPYPTPEWANAPTGDGPGLRDVLGLNVDRAGILWMLDGQDYGQGDGHAGRIIGWDTTTETLHRIIYLAPPVTRPTSFLNDLAIDREHGAIYITDTGSPDTAALIVVDLATGRARRVLEGSRFTRPEEIDMVIDGRTVTFGGGPARIGANPITIDPTNTWVYFAPMSGTAMYRVRTSDLRNEALSDADLAARVERYGDKPISDGSTVDNAGNVYITDITNDAIGVIRPGGAYEVLYKRDDLSWPDGFAFGPQGHVYATINELHRSPVLNGGDNGAKGEFKIVRFKALADGAPGR